jgi:transcriptional regulator with XRE-family HTH domain
VKRANDIGQHIAKIRVLRGLSQEATVAKIQCLGGDGYRMTVQMLKNIETGRTNVYHWHIRNIRTVLRCSYDEIFLGPKVNGSEMNALLKNPLARDRNGH